MRDVMIELMKTSQCVDTSLQKLISVDIEVFISSLFDHFRIRLAQLNFSCSSTSLTTRSTKALYNQQVTLQCLESTHEDTVGKSRGLAYLARRM